MRAGDQLQVTSSVTLGSRSRQAGVAAAPRSSAGSGRRRCSRRRRWAAARRRPPCRCSPLVVTSRPKTVPVAGSKRQSSAVAPAHAHRQRARTAPAGTGRRGRARGSCAVTVPAGLPAAGAGPASVVVGDRLLAVEVAQRPAARRVVLVQGDRAQVARVVHRGVTAAGRSARAGSAGPRISATGSSDVPSAVAGAAPRRGRWPATPRRGWGRRRRRPARRRSAERPDAQRGQRARCPAADPRRRARRRPAGARWSAHSSSASPAAGAANAMSPMPPVIVLTGTQ